MAWQINEPLLTRSGLEIPSGSIVSYQTRFFQASLNPLFILFISKDSESAKQGIYINESPELFEKTFVKTELTKAEFLSLNLIKIEGIVKQYLIDSGIQESNLVHVDILPES